tara:strand:+ start:484 stop:669 length:186 start_codon:yes stop_codon:yes gene_type:complete
MQFTRKTSTGGIFALGKFLVKLIFLVIFLFIGVVLIAKVDFPAPNKKIEKVIPNENFKKIK